MCVRGCVHACVPDCGFRRRVCDRADTRLMEAGVCRVWFSAESRGHSRIGEMQRN